MPRCDSNPAPPDCEFSMPLLRHIHDYMLSNFIRTVTYAFSSYGTRAAGDVRLEDMLQFITGAPYFTSNATTRVYFLPCSYANTLPMSHTCAREMALPTVHATYSDFRQAMTTALEFGGVGFGTA